MAKLAWFASKNGRYFTHACVGVAAFSVFGAHVALQGPKKEKFKKVFQLHSDGIPKPLSPTVNKLIKEVLDDSKLSKKEKEKLTFFNVIGFDLYHFGGFPSPWGAMIGLPFMFEKASDIQFSQLRLKDHEPLDWVIDGHDFKESLTLSEKAKKFAIMKEIYSCDFWSILENAGIASCSILLTAALIRKFNERMNSFERFKIRNRSIFYAMSYLGAFILYRLVKDPGAHILQKKADELAAQMGPEYLDGGIEFYEKKLQTNIALRTLLTDGEKKFDENGNELFYLLVPKLPIRNRLQNLKKMKEELSNQSTKQS